MQESSAPSEPKGALAGLVVVDLTRHIAGPYCTQILGDMGADVIKVESLAGDDTRLDQPVVDGIPLYFTIFNRNKRSLSLDFRNPSSHTILDGLIQRADVLIQNFRPGVMEKMGYPTTRVRELRPDIVYVSISGFGPRGTYAGQPAFDEVLQAMSGLMELTGQPDGPPTLVGVPVIDILTGLYAVTATLVALVHRTRTGVGQTIDTNLYETALNTVNPSITRFLLDRVGDHRNGNQNRHEAGINTYRTLDDDMMIVAFSDGHWRLLATEIGGPELASDPRFASIELRAASAQELDLLVSRWTATQTREAILDRLSVIGVPCGPVRTISDVASDPDLQERLITVHANGRPVPVIKLPIDMSLTPPREPLDPPALGEHTHSILTDFLEFSDQEVQSLIEGGVIAPPAIAASPAV